MSTVDEILARNGITPTEIKHYGVLGMKWGVRKDRSSGRSTSKDSRSSSGKKDSNSSPQRRSNTFRAKPENRRMSDAELRQKLNRIQMEKQYRELTTTPKSQNFLKQILAESGKTAMKQVASRAVNVAVQVAIEKAAGRASGDTAKFLTAMAEQGQKKKNK